MKFNYFPDINNGFPLVIFSLNYEEIELFANSISKIMNKNLFSLNSEDFVNSEYSCLILCSVSKNNKGMIKINNYKFKWELRKKSWENFYNQIISIKKNNSHIFLESGIEDDIDVKVSINEYSDQWWINHADKSFSEIKRRWLNNLKSILLDLSDLEMQRIKWLENDNLNPYWSYIEFSCNFFDDLLLTKDSNWLVEECILSESKVNLLNQFYDTFNKYEPTDPFDHKNILLDKEWIRITKMAERTLIAIFEETK